MSGEFRCGWDEAWDKFKSNFVNSFDNFADNLLRIWTFRSVRRDLGMSFEFWRIFFRFGKEVNSEVWMKTMSSEVNLRLNEEWNMKFRPDFKFGWDLC